MTAPIINLLQPRTVLVRAGKAVGTGSMIAPGKILTCAHVVRKAQESGEKIDVYFPNPDIPGEEIPKVEHHFWFGSSLYPIMKTLAQW